MLTLHKPLQLNSLTNAVAPSDAFDQKIMANYALMQAQFTPKDLLFLLAAPPELPENLGGMTTFAVQNNVTDRSELMLTVVNHVLNRILLSNTQDFTYQDQVYIDGVLQKLGVTDVSEFMRQVRLLHEENTSIAQLSALYEDNLTVLQSIATEAEGQAAAASAAQPGEMESDRPAGWYLHQEIYQRLQTARIYNEIATLQHDQTSLQQTLRRQEFHLAEQRRISNFLQLTEMKNQVRQGDALQLTYLENQYETGELLPPPADEEQVIEQLAQASLLDAVGRAMVTASANHIDLRSIYLDLRQALSQTAENTLARYQSYHSEQNRRFQENTTLAESRNALYREEIHLLNQLLTGSPAQQSEQSVIRQRDVIDARHTLELTHRMEAQAADETEITETTTGETPHRPERTSVELNHILTERLEQAAHAQKPPARRAPMPSLEEVVRTHTREHETMQETRRIERERLTQALRQVIRAERELSMQSSAMNVQTIQNVRNFLQNEQISVEARTAVSNLFASRPAYRTLLQLEQQAQSMPPAETVHLTEAVDGDHQTVLQSLTEQHSLSVDAQTALTRLFHTQSETIRPPQTETVHERAEIETRQLDTAHTEQTETVHESTETNEKLLREHLDRVNEHNRVMAERLQQIVSEKAARTPKPMVDGKSAMDNALRALSEPESVLREVLEHASPAELTHTGLPPLAEALLAQADEPTRRLYEAVLLGQPLEGSEGAASLLQPGNNLGAFNAEMKAHEHAAPSMIHDTAPGEVQEHVIRETAYEVAQRLLDGAATQPQQQPHNRAPLSLVHKQEQQFFTDEMLETLSARQETKHEESVTHGETVHRQTQLTDVQQVNRRTVERTTEDVSELINRTLARQLGTISDKVYSQMEKRLRMERARRGR